MEYLLVIPILLSLCFPGVATGLFGVCFACVLAGGESVSVLMVLIAPVAAALLIGFCLDQYVFGAVKASPFKSVSLFAPVGSVLAVYLLLCSDAFIDILLLADHVQGSYLRIFLVLLNDIVLVASFISLVLILLCLLCELPVRWFRQASFRNISLRLASLRPLLMCFVLSTTLHLITAVIEDDLFRGLKKPVAAQVQKQGGGGG